MRFFFAHTSDIRDEPTRLRSVLESMRPYFVHHDLEPAVFDWPSAPAAAGKPQDVIFDASRPETWDVFILAVWQRLGSPTGNGDSPSGIVEEFLKAYSRWSGSGAPNIMVYRSLAEIDPSHADAGQFQKLQQWLADICDPRGKTPVHIKTYKTLAEFENLLRHDILSVLFRAIEQTPAPRTLRKALLSYSQGLNETKLLNRIVRTQCNQLREHVDQMDSGKLTRIDTQVLYETILATVTRFESVDIIDQDITRWTELVDKDAVLFSTFNYSRDILVRTIDHAVRNKNYVLRRVFILNRDDVGARATRTLLIANRINDYVTARPEIRGQMDVRYCVIDEPSHTAPANIEFLRAHLANVEDVVIVKGESESAVLREHINYSSRRPARDSKAEITSALADTESASEAFDEAFSNGLSLDQLTARINHSEG